MKGSEPSPAALRSQGPRLGLTARAERLVHVTGASPEARSLGPVFLAQSSLETTVI